MIYHLTNAFALICNDWSSILIGVKEKYIIKPYRFSQFLKIDLQTSCLEYHYKSMRWMTHFNEYASNRTKSATFFSQKYS